MQIRSLAVRLGNIFFQHRNRLFPALMVAGLLLVYPHAKAEATAWDETRYLGGLLVCLAGQVLRALTVGYDYIKRGGKQQHIWAGRLVHRGLFAHTRNPLYLGNLLIFTGLVIVIHHPVGYLVGLPVVATIYQCMVMAEEDFLARKFGADYTTYQARVNRWWPNWRGFSSSIAGLTFRWKRVLNKEYGTAFAWVAVALLLRIWSLRTTGTTLGQGQMTVAVIMLGITVPAYALVRFWKKSGRLAEDDPRTIDS